MEIDVPDEDSTNSPRRFENEGSDDNTMFEFLCSTNPFSIEDREYKFEDITRKGTKPCRKYRRES